jgi:RNA polymerase sigma-70 factor (ECF subfamily)
VDRIDKERTRWFAQCILPHEPALRRWLARHTIAGIETDDVIQETYSIFAQLEQVDTIRFPRAYLFQVARSVIARHVRRARIVSIQAVGDLERLQHADDTPGPEQCAIAQDELRELTRAIAAMPARTQEAFILRRVEGLSQKEIAARMQVTENTVETHVGRGIRFLGEWFARSSGTDGATGSVSGGVENTGADGQRLHQRRH